MAADWVTCAGCGLKHRQRDDNTCPKCGAAIGVGSYQPPVYTPPVWQGPVSEQPIVPRQFEPPDPTPQRELAAWHIVLIFLFPIGALLTLRSGYSAAARIGSLGWLMFVVIVRLAVLGAATSRSSAAAGLDDRAIFVAGFKKHCLKKGNASAAWCTCMGGRLYDSLSEEELTQAVESIVAGRPDPRVAAAGAKCDGR